MAAATETAAVAMVQTGRAGSRFKISLPVAPATEAALEEQVKPVETTSSLSALVVDDEVEVGELNAEMLRREGFDVEFVSSGEEALARLRSGSFDLFLSDLNMPGVDGRKIYETLVSEIPEMLGKTAFVTGDTMGQSSLSLLEESGLPFLEKPVSPSEFRELIADLLSYQKEGEDG